MPALHQHRHRHRTRRPPTTSHSATAPRPDPPWHGSLALYIDAKAGRISHDEFARRHAQIRDRINRCMTDAGQAMQPPQAPHVGT